MLLKNTFNKVHREVLPPPPPILNEAQVEVEQEDDEGPIGYLLV